MVFVVFVLEFVVFVVHFVVFVAVDNDHFSEDLDEYQPWKCMNGELRIAIKQLSTLKNIVILLEQKCPQLLLKNNGSEIIL